MEAQCQVEVACGVGILGDRYATGHGHWSDPRWPNQDITFVEAEAAAALAIDARDLRRNVVTQGLHLGDLIGRRFSVGEAQIVGIRPCDPCRYLDGLTRPGLATALAGRGGLRGRIVIGGTIRVADRLSIIE